MPRLSQLPSVVEQFGLQSGRASIEVRPAEEAMNEPAAIGKVYDQTIAIGLVARGNRQAVFRAERGMCKKHHCLVNRPVRPRLQDRSVAWP